LILRARKKSDQLAHINAMSALITHLERLDVDDKVTPYSARLAERANLHIANLDDHRPQPDKSVPILADRDTAGEQKRPSPGLETSADGCTTRTSKGRGANASTVNGMGDPR